MKNIFKRTPLKRFLFFLFGDIVLISLSVVLAFAVRFEGLIPGRYSQNIFGLILLALIFSLPLFYFFKLYSISWLYVSASELIALTKAASLSFLLLVISFFLLKGQPLFSGFPRSTIFISYFFIFLLCGGLRFAKRIWLRRSFFRLKRKESQRTLIVGAGDAGEQILRSILNSPRSSYRPLGLVDDSQAKQGIQIHGLRVLGKIKDIPQIVKEKKVECLIVALPSAASSVIKEAVKQARKAGLKKIKIVPSLEAIMTGQASIANLREVEMEDLLAREPVNLDQKAIESFIKNKTALITGGAGSIGSELCRQVAKFSPSSLLILDQDETGIFNIKKELVDGFPGSGILSLIADIRDEKKINRIFSQYRPQLVFHAAAYKHVPLMEEHSEEATRNNIFGTKNVAEAAAKYGTEKFIFISTDKAVNPKSVMGASKRIGEMICQSLNGNTTKFISVRFGNVLDSRGSVIPIFREQIKKGGPVEVTHPEMKRYFMTCAESCVLVLQSGAMGRGGEVFVLDMGKPIKIADLAKEMIRFSGLEPDKDIPIVYTEPRPGEKLFEDILTAEEGTVATQNQKIFIAKLAPVNPEKLNSGLAKLKAAADENNKDLILQTLKELIPSFNPNQ